ncbi:MAG: Yip1 family protein [Erythrobacter sp.]|jgi:hypothetical protein|nr:Yip1 family protein [Erythrobacter sp.]
MSSQQDLQNHAQGIIARVKAVATDPAGTWPVIAGDTDQPMQVFTRFVMPLLAIGPIASFIGGQLFGYGGFGFSYRPSFMSALGVAITSYVLSLLAVWVLAFIANTLSPRFGGKDDYPRAFRLVAYSMSFAWVVGIVGLIPALGFVGLVGLYSLYLFYKGAPIMMGIEADKSVVYTVIVVIAAILANLIIGVIASSITGPSAAGSFDASGDEMSIDMGDFGQIEVTEDGTTAKITVDGEEITVKVPEER